MLSSRSDFFGGRFGTGVRAASGFGGVIALTKTPSVSSLLVIPAVGLDKRVDVRHIQRKLIAALEGHDRAAVIAQLH
jgi:hypothetical protein